MTDKPNLGTNIKKQANDNSGWNCFRYLSLSNPFRFNFGFVNQNEFKVGLKRDFQLMKVARDIN